MAARARRRPADRDHREHAVRGHSCARARAGDGRTCALSVSGGVVLSFFAAAAPALEASRVTPLAALRSADRLESRYRVRTRHVVAGVGLLLIAACVFAAGSGRRPAASSVSPLPWRSFSAWRSWCPLALSSCRAIGGDRLGKLFGVEGALAHANLSGAIPRLAVSVAALAVALSMMVAIAIMIGSFRETVIYWVGQTLQADLYLATARRSSLDTQATVSPELERIIRHIRRWLPWIASGASVSCTMDA